MKKTFTILFLVFICCSNSATAQAPIWLWAKGAGGTSFDYGNSVSTDANGNVIMIGDFSSPTINFGATTLTNANVGNMDIFIAKYDGSGNVLWAKSAGDIGIDHGISVVTDSNGDIIISGDFTSPTITFGTTTLINMDGTGSTYDIFMVKYDSNGNVIWAISAGGGIF